MRKGKRFQKSQQKKVRHCDSNNRLNYNPNLLPDDKHMPHQSKAIDKDGFLIDVDIQPISNTPKPHHWRIKAMMWTISSHWALSRKTKIIVMSHLFVSVYTIVEMFPLLTIHSWISSKKSAKHQVSLVVDVTTCQQHMESYHKVCWSILWSLHDQMSASSYYRECISNGPLKINSYQCCWRMPKIVARQPWTTPNNALILT